MSKATIASVIKEVKSHKPKSVRQLAVKAKELYPDLGISEKAINEYLYNESYIGIGVSCESYITFRGYVLPIPAFDEGKGLRGLVEYNSCYGRVV